MTAKEHRRGPWSQEEDQYLLSLVKTHGATNWVKISNLVASRTPKQCRERYHQNLKPTLNTEPITPEEGAQIEKLVNEMGKRWAEIARRLPNRSDNAVKNWWNGGVNRRKRRDHRRSDMAASHHRVHQHQIQVPHGVYTLQPPVVGNQYDPRLYPQDGGAHFQQQNATQLAPLLQHHQHSAYLQPPVQYSQRSGHGDSLLPSPATDTFSQRNSMEGAPPSLVSDHGSTGSYYSPASPTNELQPSYQHQGYQQPRDSYVRSSLPAYHSYQNYPNPASQVSSYSNQAFEKPSSSYCLPSNVPQSNTHDSSYGSEPRHHSSSYSTPRAQDQIQSSYAEVSSYHDPQQQSSAYGRRLPQGQLELPEFNTPRRQSQLSALEPKLSPQAASPPKDGRMGLNRIVN